MSAEATVQTGLFDCRDSFAVTMEAIAAADPRVAAVVNDSASSTKLKGFRGNFPERFVNVGIAEQNMVGVGAGLAAVGMIPFVCGASCFLTARAMEQVKVDLGYARNNVKLCGMAYSELGPTHHSIEDLAWMCVIPNLTVIVPVDPVETKALFCGRETTQVRSSSASAACPCRCCCRRITSSPQAVPCRCVRARTSPLWSMAYWSVARSKQRKS